MIGKRSYLVHKTPTFAEEIGGQLYFKLFFEKANS